MKLSADTAMKLFSPAFSRNFIVCQFLLLVCVEMAKWKKGHTLCDFHSSFYSFFKKEKKARKLSSNARITGKKLIFDDNFHHLQ